MTDAELIHVGTDFNIGTEKTSTSMATSTSTSASTCPRSPGKKRAERVALACQEFLNRRLVLTANRSVLATRPHAAPASSECEQPGTALFTNYVKPLEGTSYAAHSTSTTPHNLKAHTYKIIYTKAPKNQYAHIPHLTAPPVHSTQVERPNSPRYARKPFKIASSRRIPKNFVPPASPLSMPTKKNHDTAPHSSGHNLDTQVARLHQTNSRAPVFRRKLHTGRPLFSISTTTTHNYLH